MIYTRNEIVSDSPSAIFKKLYFRSMTPFFEKKKFRVQGDYPCKKFWKEKSHQSSTAHRIYMIVSGVCRYIYAYAIEEKKMFFVRLWCMISYRDWIHAGSPLNSKDVSIYVILHKKALIRPMEFGIEYALFLSRVSILYYYYELGCWERMS